VSLKLLMCKKVSQQEYTDIAFGCSPHNQIYN